MKNNIIFLTVMAAIFLTLACDENKPQTSSESLAGEEHLAGETTDMETAGIPIQHMDFDTIDIEVGPDFAGLDTDMD